MLPLVIAAGIANIGSTIAGGISRDAQLRVQIERSRQRQVFIREQYGRNVQQMDQNLANTQSGIAQSTGNLGASRAQAGAGGIMAGQTAAAYGLSGNMMASRQHNLQKDDMTAQFNRQILESDQQISDMTSARAAIPWQTALGVGVQGLSLAGSIYDAVQKYAPSATQSVTSSDPAEADAAAGNLENANVQQVPAGATQLPPETNYNPLFGDGGRSQQFQNNSGQEVIQTSEMMDRNGAGGVGLIGPEDNLQTQSVVPARSQPQSQLPDRPSIEPQLEYSPTRSGSGASYQIALDDAQIKADAPQAHAVLSAPADDITGRARAMETIDKLYADADLKNLKPMVDSGRAVPVFEDGQYKLKDSVTGKIFTPPKMSTADAVSISLANKFVPKEMALAIAAKVNTDFSSGDTTDWGLIPPDVRAAVINEWTISQGEILSFGNRQASNKNARHPKEKK